MTKSRLFLIVQAILCIVLAVLLASTAIGIYREGVAAKAENPLAWIYSREIAAKRFAPIAPLFFIVVGLTIGGLILDAGDQDPVKPVKDADITRDLTVSHVAQASDAMKKEQALQKQTGLIGWGAFAVCMIPVLVYLLNGDHFPNGNLEPVFRSLLVHILPWIAVGFGCLMVASVLQEKSILRETEAAKEQMNAEKAAGIQAEKKPPENPKTPVGTIRIVLLVCAVILIIAGVFNGSARDVLGKAIKICTECVGLG